MFCLRVRRLPFQIFVKDSPEEPSEIKAQLQSQVQKINMITKNLYHLSIET